MFRRCRVLFAEMNGLRITQIKAIFRIVPILEFFCSPFEFLVCITPCYAAAGAVTFIAPRRGGAAPGVLVMPVLLLALALNP